MTEDERIKEIAQILVTGALRHLRQQRQKEQPVGKPFPVQAQVWDLVADSHEKTILRHLQANGSASPTHLEQALGIPHVTLARRLARLRSVGLISVTKGGTRSALYSLAPEKAAN